MEIKKTKYLIFIVFLLFFLDLLAYYFVVKKGSSLLSFIYSNLDSLNNSKVSIKGIAFTNSAKILDGTIAFYLENNNYLIDVRGFDNIEKGEIVEIEGKVITSPIVMVWGEKIKKLGKREGYSIQEKCENVKNLRSFKENEVKEGELFTTIFTLSNYTVKTIFPEKSKEEFVYRFKWYETDLNSFYVSSENITFSLNKKYKVCAILLPSYKSKIIRIFSIWFL